MPSISPSKIDRLIFYQLVFDYFVFTSLVFNCVGFSGIGLSVTGFAVTGFSDDGKTNNGSCQSLTTKNKFFHKSSGVLSAITLSQVVIFCKYYLWADFGFCNAFNTVFGIGQEIYRGVSNHGLQAKKSSIFDLYSYTKSVLSINPTTGGRYSLPQPSKLID